MQRRGEGDVLGLYEEGRDAFAVGDGIRVVVVAAIGLRYFLLHYAAVSETISRYHIHVKALWYGYVCIYRSIDEA